MTALAIGDGALGFRMAIREVFPESREQRYWFHKQANALAALPKSAHPNAIKAMQEIYDADVLLDFYRYPAEHWLRLRTTNPILAGTTFKNGEPVERGDAPEDDRRAA